MRILEANELIFISGGSSDSSIDIDNIIAANSNPVAWAFATTPLMLVAGTGALKGYAYGGLHPKFGATMCAMVASSMIMSVYGLATGSAPAGFFMGGLVSMNTATYLSF